MASPNDLAGSSKDGELVVPVSELRATISTMLKEALKEHEGKDRRDKENRKGRVTRLSLDRLSR